VYQKRALKIVVVGGNDAGMAAAGRAKRRQPDAEVIVLEKSSFAAYASCSLPWYIAGRTSLADVRGEDAASVLAARGIDLYMKLEATEIQPGRRTVLCIDHAKNQTREYKYDRLILALGALPVTPAFVQEKSDNVFFLRGVSDAIRVANELEQRQPRRAVVIGSGYLGLEMAEALHTRGLSVVVIEKEKRVAPFLHESISTALEKRLAGNGIEVVVDAVVERLHYSAGRATDLALRDGRLIDADLFFIAAGAKPNVDLAEKAGIPLGPTGAIVVNGHQQTRRMNIYAAGDCCESVSLATKQPIWSPLAGVASKQGRVAGDHAVGGRATFSGVLGTSFVKVFGLECGRTGLTREEAKKAHIEANESVIVQPDKPGHMDGSAVTVVLLADRISKRVLGAQMIGECGVGHRLNIVATAIAGKLRLQELAWLDFGYTPPINSMWDPVQVAAQAALKK